MAAGTLYLLWKLKTEGLLITGSGSRDIDKDSTSVRLIDYIYSKLM